MSKAASALKKELEASATPTKTGRVFKLSMKGIPRVDAALKARLQSAARDQSRKRRGYPEVVD